MADGALVVVDAVAGVEVQTQKAWSYAEEYGLPRIVVVNRMDRDRASFARTLDSLQSAFGRGVVPIAIPLGEEKGFVGVADLVIGKADVYTTDQSGKFETVDVPAEVKEEATTWREKLVEMVAESNEDLMEAFFDKGTLPQEDLVRGLRAGVLAGKIFPVLPTSSVRNVGMQPLLDAIVDLLPSPVDRGAVTGIDPDTQGRGHPRAVARRRPSPRSSSRPSPTPTPGASACSASTRGRSSPTPTCPTRRGTSWSGWDTWSFWRARPRPRCPRSWPATSARWPS